jgi:hypothetical protein
LIRKKDRRKTVLNCWQKFRESLLQERGIIGQQTCRQVAAHGGRNGENLCVGFKGKRPETLHVLPRPGHAEPLANLGMHVRTGIRSRVTIIGKAGVPQALLNVVGMELRFRDESGEPPLRHKPAHDVSEIEKDQLQWHYRRLLSLASCDVRCTAERLKKAFQSRSSVGICLADFSLHEFEKRVSLCFGQAAEMEIRSPEPFSADQAYPIPILLHAPNLTPDNALFAD